MDTITEISATIAYQPTMHLRQVRIKTLIGVPKHQIRLQQMWQGSDGSQIWKWVDIISEDQITKTNK